MAYPSGNSYGAFRATTGGVVYTHYENPLVEQGDAIFVFVTVYIGGAGAVIGNAAVTISSANPGIFAYADDIDRYFDGQQVHLTTTGTLPGTLAIETTYYVVNLDATANTFNLALTAGGSPIDTSSGAGAGTHTIFTSEYGWQIIGTTVQSGSSSSIFACRFNCSPDSICPTFNVASNRVTVSQAIVIKNGASVHAFARSDYVGQVPIFPEITTNVDDCLILYGVGDYGASSMNFSVNEVHFLNRAVNGSLNKCELGWANALTAGTYPAITGARALASNGGNCWAIAIASANPAEMRGELRPKINMVRLYGPWPEPGAYSAPNSAPMNISSIDGYPVGDTAVFADYATYRGSISTSLTSAWIGGFDTFAAKDLSGKVISVPWATATNMNTVTNYRGIIFIVADSAGNWRAFRLAQYRYGQIGESASYLSFIDIEHGVVYQSSGTLDTSDITAFGFMWARTGTANLRTITIGVVHSHNVAVAVGGSVAKPLTWQDLKYCVNGGGTTFAYGWDGLDSGLLPLSGSQQITVPVSLQLGDGGITTTHIDLSGCSLETPLPYAQNYLWNVADDKVKIVIKAGDNDTVHLASSIFKANSPQIFTIHPDSSLLATYSFGQILGWKVTWKTGVPCDGAAFISGSEIDGKAAHFTNCTISASTGTHALALDAGGSVAGTSFTKGQDTYALNLREAGAYNLSGAEFSGYTTPVHVTAVSGTVTITLADGQSAPAYVSDGATVTIAEAITALTISAQVSLVGAEIRLYDLDTSDGTFGTELSGVESCSTATYSYTGLRGNVIAIQIMLNGFVEYMQTITLENPTQNLNITLAVDTNA